MEKTNTKEKEKAVELTYWSKNAEEWILDSKHPVTNGKIDISILQRINHIQELGFEVSCNIITD